MVYTIWYSIEYMVYSVWYVVYTLGRLEYLYNQAIAVVINRLQAA